MRIKIVAQSNISVVVSTSLLQKTKQRTLLLCFFCPTIEIKMKNISPSSCEKCLKIARKFPVLTVFCLGWRGSWWWRLIWSPAMLMSSTMRASLVRKHFNTSPSSSHKHVISELNTSQTWIKNKPITIILIDLCRQLHH